MPGVFSGGGVGDQAPGDWTVGGDLQVNGDASITGEVMIGGTPTTQRQFNLVEDTGSFTVLQIETKAANSSPQIELKNDATSWIVQADGGNADALTIRQASINHFVMVKSTGDSTFLGEVVGNSFKPGSFTVATLPSASGLGAGAMIYVTDETGGATGAQSDATNWRRYSDRAIVS